MTNRIKFIGTALVLWTALTACGSSLQQAATPTPPPKTPTSISSTSTQEVHTETPEPPTAEPTAEPIAVTSIEDMTGIWLRTVRGLEYRLEIRADGSPLIEPGGNFKYALDLSFQDGLLHVYDLEREFDDCPGDSVGIYAISGVPGEYLTFEAVDDPCINPRGLRGKWMELASR